MRFSKAALESEGWRRRAPDPEPVKAAEPVKAEPSAAEILAPALAELAAAMRVKPQPAVVVQESKSQLAPVKGIKVIRNKDGLIDRFELIY